MRVAGQARRTAARSVAVAAPIVALAVALAVALTFTRTHAAPPAPGETAIFAIPSPGSAVGLLTQVIKENHLDERNGIVLDVKYFDPAATEQAVILRRADAGIIPVVSAARIRVASSCSRMSGSTCRPTA